MVILVDQPETLVSLLVIKRPTVSYHSLLMNINSLQVELIQLLSPM